MADELPGNREQQLGISRELIRQFHGNEFDANMLSLAAGFIDVSKLPGDGDIVTAVNYTLDGFTEIHAPLFEIDPRTRKSTGKLQKFRVVKKVYGDLEAFKLVPIAEDNG